MKTDNEDLRNTHSLIKDLEERLDSKKQRELSFAETEANIKGEMSRERLRAHKLQEDIEDLVAKYFSPRSQSR